MLWGCTTGGVYVPYIYLHVRWELPYASRVFGVAFFISFECRLPPLGVNFSIFVLFLSFLSCELLSRTFPLGTLHRHPVVHAVLLWKVLWHLLSMGILSDVWNQTILTNGGGPTPTPPPFIVCFKNNETEILTQTHSMPILGEIPLVKSQNNTNNRQTVKNEKWQNFF